MGRRIEGQYLILLRDLLESGVHKKDRTGTGTISLFGRQIRHNMSEGFPLLTTKKMYFKGIVTELLWFLRGDTNIKYLLDNDCHIWDGDAFKYYYNNSHEFKGDWPDTQDQFIERIKSDAKFAERWGELGPIYGAQWREWYTKTLIKTTIKDPLTGDDTYVEGDKWIDQIQNLIQDLKTNPDSRRLMVNAWNVGQLDQMTLPPCHYGFQVWTRELSDRERYDIWFRNNYETGMERNFDRRSLPNFDDPYYVPTPERAISLAWNQRSVDTFLGLPFNIASYALLLEILVKAVNMVPEELIGNLGDVHLYLNHVDQAREQLTRQTLPMPNLVHMKTDEFYREMGESLSLINHLDPSDFKIENYEAHPPIKAPLSN